MEGELGGRHGHPTELAASLKLVTERGVETIALSLKEFAVRDLGEQGVSEGVSTASVACGLGVDEHALGHRGPKRARDRGHRHLEHSREELVVDAPTGGSGAPQDAPGRIGE
jgi:hypothetical protein